MAGSISALEADFLARRTLAADVPGAFAAAFAPLDDGSDPALPALRRAGEAIAAAVDTMALPGREPAYHNRHHAAEATLAMAAMVQFGLSQGLVSRDQAALGVVAMVGHDLGHDGSTLGGGVLEARSWASVRPIALEAGVEGLLLEALGDVILATDPALVVRNADRLAGRLPPGSMGRGQDALRAMANEADICASLLPRLGPRLSLLLAEEWRPANDPILMRVGTAAGRCGFLRFYPPFSGPSVALGLEAARSACLATYEAIALAMGKEPVAEAGCQALDRLPLDEATDLYERTLDQLDAQQPD